MDEYTVLVEGVIRDALGIDGARGAEGLPAEPLAAPDFPRRHEAERRAPTHVRRGADGTWDYAWDVEVSL